MRIAWLANTVLSVLGAVGFVHEAVAQPRIDRLTPVVPIPADANFTITIYGSGFTQASVVGWSFSGQRGTFVRSFTRFDSPIQLRVFVEGSHPIKSGAGLLGISVTDGSLTSSELTLTMRAARIVSRVSPTSTPARTAFELTLTGTGFQRGDQISLSRGTNQGGTGEATEFVSSSQLKANIAATTLLSGLDIMATGGTLDVTVFTWDPPSSGGSNAVWTANKVPLTLTDTVSLSRLDPASMPAGSQGVPLTAYGTGFTAATRLEFRDERNLTVVPSGQSVNVQLGTIQFMPGQDILAVPRNWTVTAVDGPSRSNGLAFSVTGGPTITNLSPDRRLADSQLFRLTLNGSGFTSESIVLFGSSTIAPVAADRSATQIVVSVPAPATAGHVDVRVRNGTDPAAVTSDPKQIEFTQPGPVITNLSPSSLQAGSVSGATFPLTITGSNLAPTPSVTVGGSAVILQTNPEPTATSVTVAVPRERLQSAGNVPVVVTVNGIASTAFNFIVMSSGPSITSLNPPSSVAGAGAFALTINGVNLSGATVTFDETSVPVSPNASTTSLAVAVSANLTTSAKTARVEVTTGGVKASRDFIITAPVIPAASVSSAAQILQPNSSTMATVALASAAPVDVNGTLALTFNPAATVAGLQTGYTGDPALVFLNGGERTLKFLIRAQSTAAVAARDGSALGAIQVGTIAGTVNVGVQSMTAADVSQSVAGIEARQITVESGAPVLTPGTAKLGVSGNTLTVEVAGYSPTRVLNQATVTFNIASGVTVSGSSTFTVPAVGTEAAMWFASDEGRRNGSRFVLRIPFTLSTGAASDITGFSISLTGLNNTASNTLEVTF